MTTVLQRQKLYIHSEHTQNNWVILNHISYLMIYIKYIIPVLSYLYKYIRHVCTKIHIA